MIFTILRYKLKNILKFQNRTVLSLLGIIISTGIFIVISHITSFETSFDKYHNNYKNIYRVQNNRIYPNLNDESAGCPPATCPVIQKEVEGIMYTARIKPLLNSIISISKANQEKLFQHNNLFYADNSVFQIFTFSFVSGNPEFALDEVNKAVISRSFAKKYFGSENVLGEKFICKNNEATNVYTVSAIIEDLPANSYLDFDCLLSFKTLAANESKNRNMATYWGWNAFNTFVKLKPNVDTALINNQLAGIVSKYNLSENEMTRVFKLQPLEEIHLHSNLRHEIGRRNNVATIYILTAISIFILLIAWINYINISTIKSRKEILVASVKRVLGSKQRQLFFENIIESCILNLVSVFFSVILVITLSSFFKNLYDVELHALSTGSWFFVIGLTFSLAILSGLYPSIVHFGISKITERKNIINTGHSSVLRNGLVVFQFVVSIVFIIATSIVIKQVNFMEQKQNEMNLENIVTLRAQTPDESLKIRQKSFVDKIKSLSGIEHVSVSNSIPGGDYTNVAGSIRQLGMGEDKGIKCRFFEANEDYFDLYNIEFLAGENFSKQPSVNKNTVIINNTALKMLGFNEPREAINKQIILGELDGEIKTITAVINDFYHKSLDEPIHPTIINYDEYGSYISIRYDKQIDGEITALLKSSWKEFFPNQPFDYEFNDKFYSAQYDSYRVFAHLVSTFALFIVFVSCIGLYSLARYVINNKIKEIGIRKVNGAKIGEVLVMLNKDFVRWVVIAFLVAIPVAWYIMNKWLETFAYKTKFSWWVFVLGGILALGIALLTVSWQAWNAARRNPVEALRYE